jgi:prevent-host-death family protein
MKVVNVNEAKSHFSKFLALAHTGEEIVIAKAGQPYAKLVPLEPMEERTPGIAKGAVTDAFFEPLPEEELRGWNS